MALVYSWAGIPVDGKFTANCNTNNEQTVQLVATSSDATGQSEFISSAVGPDSDGWARAEVSGLGEGTWEYHWRLTDGASQVNDTSVQGSFTIGHNSFKFGFGSCMASNSSADTLTRMADRNPDYFFHLGDFHYQDNTSSSRSSHLSDLEMQLSSNSGLRSLVASVPSLYVKSDHDAGGGNNAMAGAWTEPNRSAYKQVVPHPTLSNSDGLYYTFVIGRVRFIVTDARYLRTPSSMLGTTQHAWFKQQLTEPEPLKIWVQDATYITDEAPEGEDKWCDYENDRDDIGQHWQANGVGELITIHGDQHALAADDGSNNDWGGFATFAAAAFDRTASHKSSAWSDGIYPTSEGATVRQYGMVEITDSGSQITAAFTGYDSSDNSRVTLSVVATATPEDPDPTPEARRWHVYSGGSLQPVEFLGIKQGSGIAAGELFPYVAPDDPDPDPPGGTQPATSIYPNASVTGWQPTGVALKAPTSGTLVITGGDVTLDRIDHTGLIEARTTGTLTITRSRLTNTSNWVLRRYTGDVVIEDCELDGDSKGIGGAIIYGNYTLRRCNIHSFGEGPRIAGNTVIEDSWIHNIVQIGDNHTDAMQSLSGTNIRIRRNRVEVFVPGSGTFGNACYQYGEEDNIMRDVIVEDNYFNGGNYTINGRGGGTTGAEVLFRRNRFGRDYRYGIRSLSDASTWESTNVWDDNGQPV